MALNESPDTSPLLANTAYFREWLEIYKHMKNTKSGSIFDLCQMDAKTLQNLQSNNITLIKDIPADFALKPKQTLQVEALRQGKPTVHKDKIAEISTDIYFPAIFL